MFSVVPMEWLDKAWPVAEPFLARGLKAATTSTLDGIASRLRNGRDQLWLIHHGKFCGAFVTTIREEDRRFLGISNLGGTGARVWLAPLVAVMTAFAKSNKCESFRCYGRRAWTRLFPPDLRIIAGEDPALLFERIV